MYIFLKAIMPLATVYNDRRSNTRRRLKMRTNG
jgi:hypothetical protein